MKHPPKCLVGWRCVIASLLCFWASLFLYVGYINAVTLQQDDNNEIVAILATEANNDVNEHRHSIRTITANVKVPNILDLLSPPAETDTVEFSRICPMKRNICIKNKYWLTGNASDTFDARPSIKYCKGMVCSSLHSEFDEHALTRCPMYDNISVVLLGQYYPHMMQHVWSRTLNGLWEFAMRSPIISRQHHLVFEQLDYEPLYMLHTLLLQPFTHHPIQHYKNLLNDPRYTLQQMTLDNKDLGVLKDKANAPINCGCVQQAYFCGFSTDFTRNYPQGFVTRKDGNHFSWDRVEWLKQYWKRTNAQDENRRMSKPEFLERFYGAHRMADGLPIVGLVDKRQNGKWLNIEEVERECEALHGYHCKIIRMYNETEMQTPIHLLWSMNELEVLIGLHSNSIVQGGLFMPHWATLMEIIPANPLPSWLDLPGSHLQWMLRKVPQRHAWFQLFEHENSHSHSHDAGKSDFTLSFAEMDKMIQLVLKHRNEYCYREDHRMHFPMDLKQRNFTFDIKEFDEDAMLYSYKPNCERQRSVLPQEIDEDMFS